MKNQINIQKIIYALRTDARNRLPRLDGEDIVEYEEVIKEEVRQAAAEYFARLIEIYIEDI